MYVVGLDKVVGKNRLFKLTENTYYVKDYVWLN